MNFLEELRRRSVLRVAAAYLVTGWLVMQITGVIETAAGLPAWADGVALIILLTGFPIALIIAWAFELTPDGLKRTDTSETAQASSGSHQIQDIILIAGLVLVAILMLGNRFFPSETVPVEIASSEFSEAVSAPIVSVVSDSSIAVLAFDDLSPAGDQEYFSDGIAEEILNVLVRVEELDVASRTSAFQFKNQPDLGIPQIAERLNVRHVVEGSVRRDGDTIRITAQLIDASDDRHLWSQTYDAALTTGNLFSIQDEIATAIVEALQEALGLEAVAEFEVEAITDNLTAYELFLQARTLFQSRIDLDVANAFLGHAVEQDEDFSQAWELRAAVQYLSIDYEYTDLSRSESDELALGFVRRALEIEPRSATALAVQSVLRANENTRFEARHDWAQIVTGFDRALEIDPLNTEALNWGGLAYITTGDLSAALRNFENCIDVEPSYVACRSNVASMLATLERNEEAMAVARRLIGSGNLEFLNLHPILFARMEEEWAFAMAVTQPYALRGWPRIPDLYDAYRNPEVDHRELVADARRFAQDDPDSNRFWVDSLVAAIVDDRYNASDGVPIIARQNIWQPEMARYRGSDAFKSRINDSGVLAYWQAHGFPPQCRAVGADDFECD